MGDAFNPGLCRWVLIAAATLWSAGASAQMMLPGAVAPTPEGTTQAAAKPKPAKPRSPDGAPAAPAPLAVPSPLALAGRVLALNGGRSQVVFAPAGKQVTVSRLVLAGQMISNSRADCQVQADATPIATTSLGRPNGVDRLQVAFPACPIAFDILDGAVMVDTGQAACDFKAADCRVNPAGLWGQTAAEFSPARDKEIERARGHAEAAVRANYKAIVASTKDRPTIMGFARDQAQFSSTREEVCRGYAGEGQHGFCAMKLTEARAADLRAKLGTSLQAKAARKAKKAGKK